MGWLPDHIWLKQKQQQNQSKGKGNWLPDHIWAKQKISKGGGKSFSSNGAKGKDKKPVNPSRTVWVGGIPEGTTYAELKEHVDQVLPCKWAEVYTGKGKGSGLVGFATEDEAASAIAVLNGSVLKGVSIEVDAYTKTKNEGAGKSFGSKGKEKVGKGNWLPDHIWAQQKLQKISKGGGKSFGSKGSKGKGKDKKPINPSRTVWVGGIPEGTTFAELKEHVDQVLPCKWAEVYTGKGKGSGLVGFATEEEAASAITVLNGSVLKGVSIEIDAYTKAN